MGDFPSSLKSSRPVFWHSIFSLINFNFFQQLPKEMLLFPSASGAREHGQVLFSQYLISLQENTAHKLPSRTLCKRMRASIAAPARIQACLQWDNSMIKHTFAAKSISFISGKQQDLAAIIEWLSLFHQVCHFGFFLEFSLFLCASIDIFLNRSVLRSECLINGKGASPSASKALVRPNYRPPKTVFEMQTCMCLPCYGHENDEMLAVLVHCQVYKE